MIDVPRLFADFRVDSNPKVNPGWLNVRCPFCGDTGQHLGVREDGESELLLCFISSVPSGISLSNSPGACSVFC